MLVFLLLLACGLGLAVAVYRRYVAYPAVASAHVPPGTELAVRIDLTHVMFYEPFRRSILPLMDRLGKTAEGHDGRPEARGLGLGSKVQEVLVALGAAPGDWLVVLGGRFPVTGVERTLTEAFRAKGLEVEPRGAVQEMVGSGIAFGQAADGALVFGPNPERARLGLSRGTQRPELGLGSGGILVSGGYLQDPLLELSGSFRAGSFVELRFSARARPGSGEPAVGASLRALFARLAWLEPELAAAARQATIEHRPPWVHGRIRVPKEVVERTAEAIARRMAGSGSP